MKTLFLSVVFAIVVALGLSRFAVAAEKKDARVTQVIRDVRLLAKNNARPASVNDPVREGQAVRTGDESRAELTFTDQTLTRLGANTVFSFGENAKEFDLASGAVLLCVPKSAGTVKINTAAATAAVSGFTAMVDYHHKVGYKFILLEGHACVSLKASPGEPCMELGPGDMLAIPDGARRFTEKKHVDVKKLANSAKLINGFNNKLPGWALKEIFVTVDNQQNGPPPPGGGYTDPTNTDTVSQAQADNTPKPAPTSTRTPPGDRSNRPNRN